MWLLLKNEFDIPFKCYSKQNPLLAIEGDDNIEDTNTTIFYVFWNLNWIEVNSFYKVPVCRNIHLKMLDIKHNIRKKPNDHTTLYEQAFGDIGKEKPSILYIFQPIFSSIRVYPAFSTLV